MEMGPFEKMKYRYSILSVQQKRIADFFLANKESAMRLSISEVAHECNLSETTVIRFINKLDYSSYQTFRLELVQEASEKTSENENNILLKDGYGNITPNDSIALIRKKVIHSATSAICDIEKFVAPEDLEKAADKILHANQILFYGSGGSSAIAMDGHHKFMRLGLHSSYESNSHFAIIRSSHLGKKDVLILISHTGASMEVVECAKNAKENGCTVIAITSYLHSKLVQIADIALFSVKNDMPYYTDALVSRLVQLVILDILFVKTCLSMGEKGEKEIEMSRQAINPMKGNSLVKKV
ncbi:MAG: MurR/RpiR family transcriptional regulator [Spirochaetia bacterium]|jgi:DNA-binding MurR/RpiR family transcriptional regulator|nr:MurR/RpiR family transcriptional regulator [Spirochaetia bacterium]